MGVAKTLICSAALLLAACKSQEQIVMEKAETAAEQRDEADYEQRMAKKKRDAASLFLGNSRKYGDVCIAAYKVNMNDPASFEFAGSWERRIDYENVNGLDLVMDLGAWDVIYSVRFRAKNAMGGKQLSSLKCGFTLQGDHLNLSGFSDRRFDEDFQ